MNINKFEEFVRKLNEPEWLVKHRKQSFSKISDSEMPGFKHGLNINVEPDFEFERLFEKLDIKEEGEITKEIPEEIQNFLIREFEKGNTKIDYLIQAFGKVRFVKVGKEDREIVIDEESKLSNIFILLEEDSDSKIIINRKGDFDFSGNLVKVIGKKNSKVDILGLQNLSEKTNNFEKKKSIGAENSSINWMEVCVGSDYSRNETLSFLDGKKAVTDHKILFFGKGNQKFDICSSAIHNSPETYAELLTKGVLDENANIVSRSLIKINQNASNSEGYEKQDALILSPEAKANAVPFLEINNHDVSCSHGSTIGQLDKEQVFYLMSRGLSELQAKKEIIKGYFEPMLRLIKDEKISEKIEKNLNNSLELNTL